MFSDLRWLNDPDAQTMIPDEEESREVSDFSAEAVFYGDIGKAAKRIRKRKNDFIKNLKKINAYVKMGSYAWVLSGEKTASGNPILYAGPQMGFSTPSIIAEGSIITPDLRISGMTVPGLPGIIMGRTPKHAWSIQVGQKSICLEEALT